jgi:hypothetical protein
MGGAFFASVQHEQTITAVMPLLSLPTTPYADWIYTITSTTGLLVIVWLVLRPRP